jgi:hypothetical protein
LVKIADNSPPPKMSFDIGRNRVPIFVKGFALRSGWVRMGRVAMDVRGDSDDMSVDLAFSSLVHDEPVVAVVALPHRSVDQHGQVEHEQSQHD